ncbi:hypothetical protein PVK06_039948 [Gossypium arboreum]|uniref:Uncharacterized protein n=1 Tax=Gossypium arboreum TaxID=29729 RepID=A0ABR0N4X4_GOSAR|nr:hypothetical protein PVK06_039948 [Gossypium arboreum]
MKRSLQVIVLLIWMTLITELLLKFWVLKGIAEFDFKDLLLTQPNILDLACSNTCLRGIRLKLKFRDQMAQMQVSTIKEIAQLKAEAASREVEAQRKYDELQVQVKVEATRKYDELQQQLQNMMKMFQ